MFDLPEPLHPAVVHFPIVLILLGAAVACAAVVVNRWHLSKIAAVVLVLGSLAALVAVATGKADQEMVGSLSSAAEELLDAHEEWGELTQVGAGITAVLALVAAGLGVVVARTGQREPSDVRTGAEWLPRLATGARVVTAAGTLVTCFFIYETGHRGGKMVYQHGVGVMAQPSENPVNTGDHN